MDALKKTLADETKKFFKYLLEYNDLADLKSNEVYIK